LTFIDDDVEVASGWLASIQRGFSDANVAMVGGPSIPKFTGSVPAWFWGFLSRPGIGGWMCGWLSLLDIGRDVPDIDPSYIWGLNFSIRRPVLEKCGGFNPDLVPAQYQRWQGDGETGLANKVRSAGLRAVYMQDAMLMHHCGPDRLNIEYFRKRAYYQGVCDSFSHIRDGHPPLSTLAPGKDAFLFHGFRRATRKAVASLLGEKTLWHGDHAPVKIVTDKAYLDGWSFHQREVAADAALLEWVRRASYIGANFRTEGKP
jgi:GT2 family glycosyltransferase